MTRAAILIWLLLAAPLAAQRYPDPVSTTINDFAGVLGPQARGRIEPILADMASSLGVEAVLVTLQTRAAFSDEDLEPFATGLFDAWGIGDATRNDGVLLLYLHGDREVRIELGAGYGRDWDYSARVIADDFLVPNFRAGRIEVGLEKGVLAIRDNIVLRFLDGQGPLHAAPSPGDRFGTWAFYGVFGTAVAVILLGATGLVRRFRRCPNCGTRGTVTRRRERHHRNIFTQYETGIEYIDCSHCQYHDERPYSRRIGGSSNRGSGGRRSSSGGFGGGRSGGGGASGRW